MDACIRAMDEQNRNDCVLVPLYEACWYVCFEPCIRNHILVQSPVTCHVGLKCVFALLAGMLFSW